MNKADEQEKYEQAEVKYYSEDRGRCEVANCPDYYYCVPVGQNSHTCEYNAHKALQHR